jgi:PAS domain S-box-containing protein
MPLAHSRLLLRSRYAAPVTLILGVIASLVVAHQARRNEHLRIQESAYRLADTGYLLVRNGLSGCAEGLYAIRNALRLADGQLSAEQFRELAQDAIDRHLGYRSIQWVPIMDETTRQAWEEKTPAPGQRPFQIRDDRHVLARSESSPDGIYYPILFHVRSDGKKPFFGYDHRVGSSAAAIERARSSGVMTLGEKIDFSAAEGGQGLGLFLPVFAMDEGAADASRRKCLGFVAGFFYTHKLLGADWAAVVGKTDDALLIDPRAAASPEKRGLLFWQAGQGPAEYSPAVEQAFRSGWFHERSIEWGDASLRLLQRPKPGWFEQQQSHAAAMLLGGGLLLTLCFAAVVRGVGRRAELVEREVSARTAELRQTQALLEEDIRRREEAEQKLRSSQQQLQGLMENSPNAIYVKDCDGRYVSVNRRYAELHGRTREQFLGVSDFDVFPPEVATRTRASDARVAATAQPVELEETFATHGTVHTTIVHKFALVDETGAVHGVCGISTEISERKRAEAEIRENRRQLEAILGQLPGMAFRLVPDEQRLVPVYMSRGALGLTGHSARDFLEKHIVLEEIIHPDDRARARDSITTAVRKRRAYEIEYRIIDRTGRVKWVLDRGQGAYNEDSRLLFIEGLAIDITQRKDAEAEKLIVERRLLEGQKLESIGVLAGGIAHDFNNLLTGIIGNANLTALELPLTSPLQQNLKQIENASQRAAELCQQMLAYAGKGRFLIQRVDLGALVETTVPLLRASISKRAMLRFQLQPGLPATMADPTQMRQIVMNLVINASEALGENDGAITLATALVRPGPGHFEGAVLAPPRPTGEFITLEVSDTGSGMTADTLAKIFDPFFTTKFAGRGLGLAAVQGIIRSHSGGLKVRSELGRGSIFTLYFPAAGPAPTEPAPSRRGGSTVPWKQQGHALIIDDEEHVRKVTAGMLQSCGLQTEVARDGYEGIDLFRAHPVDFDLVMLDMTMPRLSGEETLHLLREIRPDVRVLFMSGYNRREVVDSLGGQGMLGFIQKPFTLEALREQLQAMLA